MAPTKQTQSKSKASDDAKDTAQPPAVEQGYATPTEGEGASHPTPGGAGETGADAANARQAVAASPLEQEQQAYDRRPPVEPQRHLSTSPVAAAAGQRSLVGQGTLGLVDEEGNDLNPDDVFDSGDGSATYVTTKVRVYEKFVQRGARTPITRLLFPANARVPRDKADAFVHAAKAEAANPLNEAAGRERMATDGTKASAERKSGKAKDDDES